MTTPGAVAVLVATQNLNAVLRVLQWGVIALIFLFFLRVIRAVWVEMSPATIRKARWQKRQERREERAASRPAEQPKPSRRKQLYLTVVQPPDHAGRSYDLDDELTIGRSPGCGVAMPQDIYTSTLHAAPLPAQRPALDRGPRLDQRHLCQLRADHSGDAARQG